MAQEHQEYIQQKVNPILENLVTQLLLERPDQPAPFMIKMLGEHIKSPAAAALTESVNQLGVMKSELEKLQVEVKQLEGEVGSNAPAVAKESNEGKDDESEEEDDDDVEDLPPPPSSYMKKERTSVSAEAYGAFNVKKAFTPPVHPKTELQTFRIKDVLLKSFLFNALEKEELGVILGAMVEVVVKQDTRIIQQGDDGDCLFVIESGTMNCYKKIGDEEKLVKVCKEGDAFGELALLYNCPRAATVTAAEPECVLWQLDRETFNHIVAGAAQKRRERYEDFLKKVPILATVDSYELMQMCDALQSEAFSAGTKIVQQGQPGDKFYILADGEAVVMKVYTPGSPEQEVMQYKAGDYFGELALLNNEKRAATVVAKTECRVVTLTGPVFKSLLGPLEDILKRKSAEYK